MRTPASRSPRAGAMVGLGTAMAVLVSLSMAARADVASDKAAAILVFPKLVVDASNAPAGPQGHIDTLIRVSNTSAEPISMRCFYVDATPQCADADVTTLRNCLSNPVNCVGVCQSHWQELDFVVNITALQPIAWLLSQGATECGSSTRPGVPCLALTSLRPGLNGQSNQYSHIPPAPQDPFVGELKCIAVDLNGVPVERNDLKGEVEITRVHDDGTVDVEGYNAIGISAIPGAVNSDSVLVLGGSVCNGGANAGSQCSSAADCPDGSCVSAGEYNGCPNILILDHFFDGAADPISRQQVTTELTLVPCSEDLYTQNPVTTSVQFLVFNEFEERFSTSRPVTCFDERPIWSIIDTRTPEKSIFSAAVAGTLTGQTRIRGVAVEDPTFGHALLGIAEEFREGGGSAAVNLHFSGSRPQSDYLYLPLP